MITSSSRVSPVIITTKTVVSTGVELRSCEGMVVAGNSTVVSSGVELRSCWGLVVVGKSTVETN